MTRVIALLLLFLSGSLLGRASREIPFDGEIPRFFAIDDGLYRGGQPTEKGFELLKQLGIKTVVNLRADDRESQIVESLGMNYVHVPIENVRPWTQIPEAAIAKYFELINNSANYPIFFHCKRGADRTGALAALYRMGIQGWDAGKAYAEALQIGMRFWHQGLKTQVFEFRPTERAKLQPAIDASGIK